MNKKVLSALLFGALMVGTGTFTSCIDNDEPAGIEQLRGAKAELIRAKAAVEAAKVAQVQAEAAVSQAQAEMIKAEAQAVALMAQLEKAQSEAEIARIEAEIAQLQAETNAYIQQAEAAAKLQEVEYQKALVELEALQFALTQEEQAVVASVAQAYESKLAKYNELYVDYLAKVRDYNAALATVEDDSVDNIETKRRLEKNLDSKKYQLSMEEAVLAKLNEGLTEAKAMTPSDMQVKFAELSAEEKALNDSLALLELEKALVREENCDEYKKADELIAAVGEAYAAEIEIPALTITDWLGEEVEIVAEEVAYSLKNTSNYDAVSNTLENAINTYKGYLLDENDLAWTAQSLLDVKKAIEAENGPKAKFEKAKAQWEAAAKAYNTTDGKVDLTAYLTYATLNDSVSAYNATIPAVTAAVAAETAAKAAVDAAVKANNDAKTLWETYQVAVAAANKKVTDLTTAHTAALKAKSEELAADKQDAFIAWEEAKLEVKKAEKDVYDNPKSEAIKKLLAIAVKAEAAAEVAYEKACADVEKEIEELEAEQELELEAAEVTQAVELAEAYLDYEKALVAAGVTVDGPVGEADGAVKDPTLAEAVKTANKAYEDAQKATKTAKDAADKAFAKVNVAFAKYQVEVLNNAPALTNAYKALEIAKVAEVTRDEAKKIVINYSDVVWGSKIAELDQDGKNQWFVDKAYLINGLTRSDMDEIVKNESWIWADGTEFTKADYYRVFFGLFGEYQAALLTVEYIETAMANIDAAKASIEALETALAELEEGKEAAEEAVEAAEEAVKAQFEVIDEFEKVVTDKIEAVESELECVSDLKWAYYIAIDKLEDYTSEEALKFAVEEIEREILDQEQIIYQKETEVMVAEKQLADWNAGEYSAVEAAKVAMETAEFYLNVAKEEVELVKVYLEAMLSALGEEDVTE